MINRDAPFDFTGPSFKALREQLGLNTSNFSRILGVSLGTVERWESLRSPSSVTPIHRMLLLHLHERVAVLSFKAARRLGTQLRQLLITRGELCALATLLLPLADPYPVD